ncbi:DUF934 domain-containing protein [Marinobacter sp.]|uniref:DUF934 domain-containing protein n=1 Tax=Marinobacter sp. TaxID=50741 RepID=UPI00384AAE4B
MPEIITRDGEIREDNWTLIPRPDEGESLKLHDTPAMIPADLWIAGREHYQGRDDIGVWLESHDEPGMLADYVDELPIVAINFPKFTDGRGYSSARLLRERYGYRNELRAVGDVLLDQLQFMKRCGFDSYVLRPDKDIKLAAHCLNFFSQAYQAAGDTEVPLFRRRAS